MGFQRLCEIGQHLYMRFVVSLRVHSLNSNRRLTATISGESELILVGMLM